jgi:cyclase
LLLIILLACLLCASTSAKEDPELTKVAEGIYARIVSPDSSAVANAGVVVMDQSVLVFDTHFTPEAGFSLLATIRSVTPKSVRYVVNSHWHADHTHGNQAFAGAQLISSSNARRDMLQNDLPSLNRAVRVAQTQIDKLRQVVSKEPDAAERQKMREQIKTREDYLQTMTRLNITVPVITLDENTTIHDGKQEARILFLGVGHTDGDVVLFLPAQKVVFAGDLFFNNGIPNVQDASILEWMKTLNGLLKLDATTFVPGHGPIGSKRDVQTFLSYLEELKSLVSPAVERGDSLEQATRDLQLPAKYSSYQFQNFFPSNVQKMYTELKGLQIELTPVEDAPKAERHQP